MATSNFNSAGQLNQIEHDPENGAKRVNNYIWNSSSGVWERDTGGGTTTSASSAAIDLFGSAVNGSRYNQVEIDFSTAAPSAITDITVTNTTTGTSSQANGQASFTTGTSTTGGVTASTNLSIVYRPHTESYAAFSAIFNAGVASSYQRIGIYNSANGFFIGYEGTSFGLTVRQSSSDTTVAQASFNKDKLDGSATSKYTRNGTPEALDPTKDNLYRIRYGWLGASGIYFEVLSPDQTWVTFHVHRTINTGVIPSIANPNLPITLDIRKTAGATSLTMSSACWAAGTTSNFQKVTDTITDNTLATLNRSVITGKSSAGGGTYVNVKVTPSGSLTTAIGDISGIVGQNTMANSIPVTIASNQSAVTVVSNDLIANISIAAAAATSGSITTLNGESTYVFQITGTWSGTIQVQITIDGTNWLNVTDSLAINSHTLGTFLAGGNITTNGIYQVDCSGLSGIRLISTAWTSGTATGAARATDADALITLEGQSTVVQPTAANFNATVVQSGTWTTGTPSATLNIGQTTSNTSATQLSASSVAMTNGVVIQALSTNTASVFIGNSSVTTSNGFELTAGSSLTISPSNINLVYVIGSNATDKVCWSVT